MAINTRLQKFQDELDKYFEKSEDHELLTKMRDFRTHFKNWQANRDDYEVEEGWPSSTTFTDLEGTTYFLWGKKLHNWDGPALINSDKSEYYLYGIQYSYEEWREFKSQWTGLPWYKTPSILADAGAARN